MSYNLEDGFLDPQVAVKLSKRQEFLDDGTTIPDMMSDVFAFLQGNNNITAFYKEGKMTDLTLVAKLGNQSENFRVHRLLLSVLPNGFLSETAMNNNQSVITFDDTDPRIFGLFLDYIYGVITDGSELSLKDCLLILLMTSRMGLSLGNVQRVLIHYNPKEQPQSDLLYIIDFMTQYYQNLNQDMIDYIADSIKSYIDLSGWNAEFVESVLASYYFKPNRKDRAKIIDNLIAKGMNKKLEKYHKK
jgi:hypothetical protein